jgi:hypothetical protein
VSAFEYLIPFISVLVGLAVTDLATSLHRLLRVRRRVEWDWIPLATALLALLMVLNSWWGVYGMKDTVSWTLGGFLPLAATLFVLFLLNAAALPGEVPLEGIDMRSFYESNSPYFWSLFGTYIIFVSMVNLAVPEGLPENETILGVLLGLGPNFVLLGISVALAFFRNRLLHAIATVVLLAFLTMQWSDMVVGST